MCPPEQALQDPPPFYTVATGSAPIGWQELIAAYAPDDRASRMVRANFISSIDGAATREGLSGGLGTPADQVVFEILRRNADVVMVGAGTIRAEGYDGLRVSDESVAWRRDAGLPDHPRLAVVSARLNLDATMSVFTEAPVRPLLITRGRATTRPDDAKKLDDLKEVADVIITGEDTVDLPAALTALEERGLSQILTEGGPHLLGALVAADSLDELCLTVSPSLENGSAGRIIAGAPAGAYPLRLVHALVSGDSVLLRYRR